MSAPSDIGICDHCDEYGDATAHNEECPLVMRAEIAALRSRLRKEEECHAQTCRLSDEWFAALNEAKRLGLEAVSVAEHEANCSLGIDNLSCDCRVERLRSALESM